MRPYPLTGYLSEALTATVLDAMVKAGEIKDFKPPKVKPPIGSWGYCDEN